MYINFIKFAKNAFMSLSIIHDNLPVHTINYLHTICLKYSLENN